MPLAAGLLTGVAEAGKEHQARRPHHRQAQDNHRGTANQTTHRYPPAAGRMLLAGGQPWIMSAAVACSWALRTEGLKYPLAVSLAGSTASVKGGGRLCQN